MSQYEIEIKQLVDYPKCRIYREFIRTLMSDRNIHSNGCSYFFCLLGLCSFANFRTSYRRIEGTSYTVYPGEWICLVSEVTTWFRLRFQHQAIDMLDYLQKQHYITYSRHARGKLIKFKINDWEKFNTVLEYNAPCQKDTGFFFFPISKANELIKLGKCSELDVILDLWINTVYNEEKIQASNVGPVVYFRNCTGDPFVSYSELSSRWSISKSTVGRFMNKFEKLDYLTLISSSGRRGSIVYLNNYLSTMFEVSDMMIDKEEIAMALNVNIRINGKEKHTENAIKDDQICVPEETICVPDSHIRIIIQKVAQLLADAGVFCCACPKAIYKLYTYQSDCKGLINLELHIKCSCINECLKYRFEVRIKNSNMGGNKNENEFL